MAAVSAPAAAPAAGVVAQRLAAVRRRIADAGRSPETVTVVAVTKGFDASAVDAARGAGLVDVGENYAQELLAKAPGAPAGTVWHFLGALQRNKVAALAPLVSLWHGIDRAAALEAVAARRPGAPVLVEVNAAGDPAKHGCAPGDTAALVARGRALGLEVRGLMTVAPAGDRDGAARCFATVAALAAGLGLPELSMGMSDDYDLAVGAGATIVRLGRVLFGPRPGRTQSADTTTARLHNGGA